MLLIQRRAIKMLETYDPSPDNKGNSELAFIKLVLSDIFTASTVSAKLRASGKEERDSTLDNVIEELQ